MPLILFLYPHFRLCPLPKDIELSHMEKVTPSLLPLLIIPWPPSTDQIILLYSFIQHAYAGAHMHTRENLMTLLEQPSKYDFKTLKKFPSIPSQLIHTSYISSVFFLVACIYKSFQIIRFSFSRNGIQLSFFHSHFMGLHKI